MLYPVTNKLRLILNAAGILKTSRISYLTRNKIVYEIFLSKLFYIYQTFQFRISNFNYKYEYLLICIRFGLKFKLGVFI